MRKLWLLAFVFVVLSSASATGIAPAKVSVQMSLGETREITFYAVNDLSSDAVVEPYVSGELAKYAQTPKRVQLKPKELTPFTITISLPKDIRDSYTSYVGVISAPENTKSGLSARIAAESLLEIKTILNKPALQLELSATNKAPISLHLTIKNPTTVPVSKISGRITISDSGLNKQASFDIKSHGLGPAEKEGQIFVWNETKDGEFTALAEVEFDGGDISTKTEFSIGERLVEIQNIKITKNDNIIEVNVGVKNSWNAPIETWADVSVFGTGNSIETQLKTQTEKVSAGENATLNAYWETDKNPDDFDFDVVVHYGEQSVKKRISSKRQADVAGTESTKNPLASLAGLTGAFSTLNIGRNKNYAIAAIVLISAIFVLLFAYSRRPPPKTSTMDEYYRKYYEYLSKRQK